MKGTASRHESRAPLPLGPTYRATFDVAAGGVGVAALLPGSATKMVHVLAVFVAKPSVATDITVKKTSAAATGGTSAGLTEVPLDSRTAVSTCAGLQYTVAPTAGTLVGNLAPAVSIDTTDSWLVTFGDSGANPVVLHGVAQTVEVHVGAACTVSGYFEWVEADY
jgi:hypothetical protein